MTAKTRHPSDLSDFSLPAFLEELTSLILLKHHAVTRSEAERIGTIDRDDALLLFHYSSKLRKHFRGDKVELCSIVNAKSGACPEDCAFCAQSAHFKTASPQYDFMKTDAIVKVARQAKADGATAFGIVISGRGIESDDELKHIGEAVKAVKRETSLDVHASVGILDADEITYLRDCGVTTIHHNLETSERHFPSICTTHGYEDRLKTVRLLKSCGMKLCAGGIFGLGETLTDRIDMAFALRDLDADTIPMNFLHPVDGTPLEGSPSILPMTALITIAMYRFILPSKEIKICGGRETNLRDLQCMIFFAGADSMMIGNYLTTAGREPELDWQMMRDLELTWSQDQHPDQT